MEFKTILYIIGFILYLVYQYRQATKAKEAKQAERRNAQPSEPAESKKEGKEWDQWLEEMLPNEWKEEIEKAGRKMEAEVEEVKTRMEPKKKTRGYVPPPPIDSPYAQYSGMQADKTMSERVKESLQSHSVLKPIEKPEAPEGIASAGNARVRLTSRNLREAVILSEILRRPEY